MKKIIYQIGLVKITFGVLISKERNSKNASPKQNGARRKNMYVKFLMDSGVSASTIQESYKIKNNFITTKPLRISDPQLLDLFLRHTKPKLHLKCQNLMLRLIFLRHFT